MRAGSSTKSAASETTPRPAGAASWRVVVEVEGPGAVDEERAVTPVEEGSAGEELAAGVTAGGSSMTGVTIPSTPGVETPLSAPLTFPPAGPNAAAAATAALRNLFTRRLSNNLSRFSSALLRFFSTSGNNVPKNSTTATSAVRTALALASLATPMRSFGLRAGTGGLTTGLPAIERGMSPNSRASAASPIAAM